MNPWPTACWWRTLLFLDDISPLSYILLHFFSDMWIHCCQDCVGADNNFCHDSSNSSRLWETRRSSAQTHSCAFTRAQPWDAQYLLDVIQRDKNGALFTSTGKGPALYVTECFGFHPGPPLCRRQTVATKLWVTLFNELENWPFWYQTDVLCGS